MIAAFHPQRWPLAVRAPLVVALLMIGIAAAISKVVLDRLARDQAQSFRQLTGAYLDGLSTALHSPVIRQEPWEAFDVLDRARRGAKPLAGLEDMLPVMRLTEAAYALAGRRLGGSA